MACDFENKMIEISKWQIKMHEIINLKHKNIPIK